LSDERSRKIAENLAVALVHYPVMNKQGREVTSSVTTIDVHDFARVCRTYGIMNLYIITPLKAQKRLVERLSEHWMEGYGATFNPSRKEALNCVKVVDTIEDMVDNFSLYGGDVKLVVTGAKKAGVAMGYEKAREYLETCGRAALLFGTGHGLASSVMEKAAVRLAPIEGLKDGFNHLPVRCAAAIIMDRLLGARD